jgi:hypothetical protein
MSLTNEENLFFNLNEMLNKYGRIVFVLSGTGIHFFYSLIELF